MPKQTLNQRDEYIWYIVQLLLDKKFKAHQVYHMISTISGLSMRTIQNIRLSRAIPTIEEIELSNL